MTTLSKISALALAATMVAGTASAQTMPTQPGTTTPPTTTTPPVATPTVPAPGTTTTTQTPAQPTTTAAPVTVGGAQMLPTATIVENASKASNLTTLVKAVTAADLAATLSGPGPFTVFAPTDNAFNRLAPGTLDTLLKPEQKPSLVKVLNYHVVAGKLDAEALKAQITAGGGTAMLNTVAGQSLTATLENGTIVLTDTNGTKTYVTQYDVEQSNGIVHVVNGVLVPKLT